MSLQRPYPDVRHPTVTRIREILTKVNLALNGRLPPELNHLVIQHALEVEDMPLDPRFVIPASH